ncbi:hypothetical protein Goari_006572 [Gossypium aridum]|uniref:Uncharacterized protein n=1 Tax=Gossypium aridum TaxID=34290 RepID=A0A7J8XNH3_GOSAI|nr:hypothetical protein [Gossypium aridum]
MPNLYVKAVPPADLNRNTEWFMYPGVWTTYILFLFFSWLLVLSIFGSSPGMAWTIVNLAHFLVLAYSSTYIMSLTEVFRPVSLMLFSKELPFSGYGLMCSLFCLIVSEPTMRDLSIFQVTYHFFHWKKGTPFADDQGIYNGLTWWEQIDNGKQLTRNRKFLTVVPVVL